MKKIFKYSSLLMAAGLAFVACKDDDSPAIGDWNATADYADVYFPTDKQTIELDPADPTTATIQIARRNTKGELTMSLDKNINTDSVFNVSDAVFADGDSIATITVNFPGAEVGKTYNLELTTSDPRYTSFYSDSLLYTLKVTRVKWVPAGFMTVTAADLAWASSGYGDEDTRPLMVEDENGNPVPITNYNEGDTIRGWVHYTDDFITSIFSVTNQTYPVKFQQREDQPHLYRLVNPYGENYIYNDPGDWDTSKDYYFIYDLSDPDAVIMQYDASSPEMGIAWSYGDFILRSLSATGNDQYVGKYENGSITFPASSFYIGMSNYNGGGFRWYANGSGKFEIVVDPSLFKYVISLADYDWEELFEGVFTSQQRGTSDNAKLYKGVCTVDDPNADYSFVEEYGTPYCIASAYAEDYDLIFTVKDGKFYLPEGYRIQPTGLDDNMGNDIYAKINTPECTFSEKEILLNVTFVNEDESIEYGTAVESIANLTWTQVGTGTYTYVAWDGDEAEPDPGYVLSKRDDKDDIYRIEEWFYGVNLQFTWDKATNQCHVPEQYTGLTHPTYGEVWVCDGPTYH
ncbi:MAG: hypothetical protein IJU11_00720, partial [Prevotella sp.]|nr:hypothetical protein [Prevotella sp.]